MPRERIKHGTEARIIYDGENPIAGESATPSLDVTWNRDAGWVQIGIETDAAFLAGIIRDGASSVWTSVLSRQEINHLIRTLRRARDSAYGSVRMSIAAWSLATLVSVFVTAFAVATAAVSSTPWWAGLILGIGAAITAYCGFRLGVCAEALLPN